MKDQTKSTLIAVILCTACVGTVILCEIFMKTRSAVLYYIAVSVLLVCPIVYCAVDKERYKHFSRTVLVVSIVAVAVVACYVLYYTTGLSDKFSDFDALKTYIRGSGFWGVAIFIGLTVFQVVVLPIPEAVTILLGVAIYGATTSFILSVIGTIIGSLISFMLGKVFGRRLCNWMFGEDNTEKYAKIMNEKGRFLFIIMLLFPAFPDDMLCMIAGITTMSYTYFTVICLVTRPVMIGLTAYLGSGVIPFSGWGIPVWISIACLMFVVFVVIGGIKSKIENRRQFGIKN
ncbi:MAG: TVP38/TMEM64 family protein [Clostridiales bacterium]|nr:TVP38/TMEM64 family protein [Clostridiales bacterium]